MNRYLKSILLFGYLPSVILVVILIGGVHAFRGGMERQKKTKQADYETFQDNKEQIAVLASYLEKEQRREKMAFIESNLDGDFFQELSRNLSEILSHYKEAEIQNTAVGRAGGSSQIASQTENNFSRVNLVFEGHYGAIQKTITELEFRMPQISLESLSLKPTQPRGSDGLSKLKIELNYLCWHKPTPSS